MSAFSQTAPAKKPLQIRPSDCHHLQHSSLATRYINDPASSTTFLMTPGLLARRLSFGNDLRKASPSSTQLVRLANPLMPGTALQYHNKVRCRRISTSGATPQQHTPRSGSSLCPNAGMKRACTMRLRLAHLIHTAAESHKRRNFANGCG